LSYRLTRGSIEGEVFFRSGKDKVPVPGMNVVARRVSRGPYPPPNDTLAYPTPPPLDADGVPAPPPVRNVTDSLATAASAVTGLDFGYGGYRIQGLPTGAYEVMLQKLFPSYIGGSRIGSLRFQLPLPYLESYFHRPTTSLDVRTFTPVLAIPAATTPKAGESAVGDPFSVQIDFGGGVTSPLHVPFAQIPHYSFTASAREIIGAFLGRGTWYLGVSVFAGDVKYHLRVVPLSP
jgi:hypothetical protein